MSIANVEINVHVPTTDIQTCIPENEYIRVPAPCSQSNLRPFKEFSRRRKQSENVRHITICGKQSISFSLHVWRIYEKNNFGKWQNNLN